MMNDEVLILNIPTVATQLLLSEYNDFTNIRKMCSPF